MAKPLKYILSGIIIILVLVIGTGIVVTQINPNKFKGFIVNKVKEQTGRDLAINGDINLKFYPWLHIELNDLVFDNSEEFKSHPFFQAQSLQFRVKTLPLLNKNIQMDVFKINGAKIHVGKNKQGIPSWADLVKPPKGPQPSAQPEKKAQTSPALGSILIGGLDIQDAAVTWEDRSADQTVSIQKFNMTTGKLVMGKPIDLQLSFSADVNKPKLATDAQLTGQIHYNIEANQYAIQSLVFDSMVKSPNIPNGKTRIKLSSNIDMDLKSDMATLSDMVLDALDTHIKGRFTAKGLQSGTPAVEGYVSIDGKDISLPFKMAEIQPLANQLADIKNRSFNMKSQFNTDLANGRAQLHRLDLSLLGTQINGEAQINRMNTKTPFLKGNFAAKGPDLPLLMQVAGTLLPKNNQSLEKLGQQLATLPNKAFDMAVNFDADLNKGNVQIPTFSAKTLGLNLNGNLSGSNINDSASTLNGSLSFDGKNLTRLFTAIGNEPLAKTLNALTFQTDISGKSGTYSLAPLSVHASILSTKKNQPPESIKFSTNTSFNLTQQNLSIQKLTLTGLGLDVKADINATKLLSNPSLIASLDIQPFNLKDLLSRLNQKPIPAADKNAFKKVALKADLSGSKDAVDISSLSAKLDETTILGNLIAKEFSKPNLEFNLDIDTLNADRYLPPKTKKTPKTKKKTTDPKDKQTELPLEPIRSLVAKGEMSIGNLVISNTKLSNVKVTLEALNGIIQLSPVAADLYDGNYLGSIRLDATQKTPKLLLKGNLNQVEVEPLLTDMTGKSKLRGNGSVLLDLESTGTTPQQLMSGLNGKMNFNFLDGAVKGFNIGKFLRSVKSVRENQSFRVSDREETDFAELTGNPVFKNGSIQLDDLSGKSPAFRIQGQGLLADLVNNAIDYTANITVVETSKGQTGADLSDLNGLTIPIRIKGSLQKPAIKPDIAGVLATLATSKLTEKLGIKIPGISPQQEPTDPQKATQQQEQPQQQTSPEDALRNKIEEEAGNLLRNLFK